MILRDGVRVQVGDKGVAFWFEKLCSDPDHHEACAIVVMVGDDYRHHVDVAELSELHDDEYCPGCGQIGCAWSQIYHG